MSKMPFRIHFGISQQTCSETSVSEQVYLYLEWHKGTEIGNEPKSEKAAGKFFLRLLFVWLSQNGRIT